MPKLDNLSCITDLIDVRNPCTADQSAVIYWFDDNGISLADTAKTADERYLTGQNMVDQKVRIALQDVYAHITRNLHPDCDYDLANGILCDRAEQVSRAVFFRATALIYKEQTIDSSRYNEFIQFAGGEAIASMLLYDSSFRIYTTAENVPAGLYQRELDKLETIRMYLEQSCCTECLGKTNWSITLP